MYLLYYYVVYSPMSITVDALTNDIANIIDTLCNYEIPLHI